MECSDKIMEGLAKEPEELATAFHKKGFIAQNVVDRINQLPATRRDKARTLYYAILDTVKCYPHRYENFLAVLKGNPRLYGDLLAALEKTLYQKRRWVTTLVTVQVCCVEYLIQASTTGLIAN